MKPAFHISTNLLISLVVLISMLFPGLQPHLVSAQSQVDAAGGVSVQSKGVSPEELLAPDGSLNLDGSFSGTLDLSGYSVQIDPMRGPVFGLEQRVENAPVNLAPINQWDNVGDGSSALKGIVRAIAVIGTDVYVGGDFLNADSLPAADHIAKWDGSNWSALSVGTNGNGALGFSAQVNALAVSGTDLYVGGSFFYVYNAGVKLPTAQYIAKWDGSNWSALGSNGNSGGSINNSVEAIAVSGTNIYVGGQFTDVNNNGTPLNAADYIAKWDGSNWSALNSNGSGNGSLNARVEAIAVSGSNVYVGGWFTNVNNNGASLTTADYLTKWDGSNWSALGSDGAGNGSINNSVHAIAVSGTDIYVGGWFSNVNNGFTVLGGADHIAKWDGSNWSALGSNGAGEGVIQTLVTDIAISGSNVYMSGWFTDVNNNGASLTTADYLTKWDGSNWSALGSNGAGNGSLNNPVYAIAVNGTELLVGGNFLDVNNNGTKLTSADYLTKWDGSNFLALGMNPNGSLNNVVYAVAVSGTDVYVGGSFTDVDNHGVNLLEADYIAKWDGSNWSALGSNGSGNGALNNWVYAIAVSGSDVYAAGIFTDTSNTFGGGDYIAKWDGSSWSALSELNGIAPLNNWANAIAISGSDVYVGGWFTDVNDSGTHINEADYIARWDGISWSALGSNGSGNGSLNFPVEAIAVSGVDVYAGGQFTNVNNNGTPLNSADFIAKWDGSNWSALGSDGAGNGSLNDVAKAVAVSGSDVYVGGYFTDVNNNGTPLGAADYIAKWDGTNWSALGSNGAGDGSLPNNRWVNAIVVSGLNVYVGGLFPDVNNNGTPLGAADHVAKWDGSNWSALGSNGSGNGSLTDMVSAIAVNGAELLVGGSFVDVNNSGTVVREADYLAAYGIDTVSPMVQSIIRTNPNPTVATVVNFTVTFSESVTGVDAGDFTLTTTGGVSGAAVSGVGGSGSVYTVTVNTGSGNGTIRLDVVDDNSIVDSASNSLGGAAVGDGNFTGGEIYTINKPFASASRWTTAFDFSHGWTVSQFVRTVGDVNNDGRDDLIGFGLDGVYVALSNGTSFGSISKWSSSFDLSHGWTVSQFVRTVGDVNNDGRDDLIGFGLDGVYVALSNGTSFDPISKWSSSFDLSHGWTVSQFVRTVGDVNNDGRDDLIGFGLDGVYVALSNGTSFGSISKWSSSFDLSHGWTVSQFVRTVGDVNFDGRDDLIGFGLDGVYVALSNGTSFGSISKWSSSFDLSHGWTVAGFVRTVGDVNNDGRDDLIGFGQDGVYVALSNGASFDAVSRWTNDFDLSHGWTVSQYVRTVGDVNADGKADLVGFGLDGVYIGTAK